MEKHKTDFETGGTHGADVVLVLRFENLYNVSRKSNIASVFYVHAILKIWESDIREANNEYGIWPVLLLSSHFAWRNRIHLYFFLKPFASGE